MTTPGLERVRARPGPAVLAGVDGRVQGAAPQINAEFLTYSMRNVIGDQQGGIYHAIIGTLLITAFTAIISVPVGIMTAVYLVEYGTGRLARGITFLVDVMTGIPSIVAGLFAYALFVLFFGPGIRLGSAGSVALSVLMIPSWSARRRRCSSWFRTSCGRRRMPWESRSGAPS